MNEDVIDVDVNLEEEQRDYDPTVDSTEPEDWQELVENAPITVSGGGGTDNSAAVQEMVRIARGETGVAESPPGSNRGVPLDRYVHYFGKNIAPSPWCAFFVSWAWDRASDGNRKVPWSNPGYVPSVQAWARQVGRIVAAPAHGDLFGQGGDHMRIVVGSDARSKMIYTVEGNYGGRVAGVSRGWSGLWFVRLS